MKSAAKFLLLGCLYFSQGVPYGFFTQALPVIMREEGASLTLIGLSGLLTLPWALKFLWAPLVDRFGIGALGARRSWILVTQGGMAVLFLVLARYGNISQYHYLVWGFLLANLLAATQDIATDGMAVNLLAPEEMGYGNGLQVAGYRVGMIVGGGLILIVFESLRWWGSFSLMAGLVLLGTVPVLLMREPGGRTNQEHPEPAALIHRATHFVKQPGVAFWLLLVAFYKFGDALINPLLRPFLKDMGLSLADIGRILGTVGFSGGLIGALAGGVLVVLLGRRRALVLFGVIQAVAILAYYLIAEKLLGGNWIYAICALEHFTGGMANAALFTIMMDVCAKPSASTDYTLQASAVVIATTLASILGGVTADFVGYNPAFLISAMVSLLGALAFAAAYRSGFVAAFQAQSRA